MMQIKRYEAPSMQEALRMIKSELGSDAVIFSSRNIYPKGILSNPSDYHWVEVTAATDRECTPKEREKEGKHIIMRDKFQSLSNAKPGHFGKIPGVAEQDSQWSVHYKERSPRWRFANKQQTLCLKEDRSVYALRSKIFLPLFKHLLFLGFDEDLAWELVEESIAEQSVRMGSAAPEDILLEQIARRIKTAGPISVNDENTKIVYFIGPTGVGKTTTLAKLAAHYSVIEKKKVSILTTDTYRIAAIEQLKIYGRIMGVPVHVAANPNDLNSILRSQKGINLALIDTAGRNYKEDVYLQELLQFYKEAENIESHLLLSASTVDDVFRSTIEGFSKVRIDRVIITKIDESIRLGHIYNNLAYLNIPVSYITTGQRVPEDILSVSSAQFSKIIWSGYANTEKHI